MNGRIKRPLTVVAAATLALLLAAPGAAMAKGPGGGGGTGGGGTGGGGTSGGGTSGGGGGGGTTSKGTTLGDLNMVLRDTRGVPITTPLAGVDCVQPITTVNTGIAAPTDASVYPYDVTMFLIPLIGGTDPAVACGIDTTKGFAAVPVDFGRLSVGRSPESVLAKQLTDVTTALTADTNGLTLDASGRIVVNDAAIDSPLQSLAIYQQLLEQGKLPAAWPTDGMVGGLNFKELAAAAFAAAADKTAVQTIDTVQYMNRILKIPTDSKVLGDTLTGPAGEKFVNYAGFTYNRSDMFFGCISYWDLTDINNPVAMKNVPIIEAVFGNVGGTDLTNAKAFASMVDDARQVLLFVHDQVEISVDPIGMKAGCTNPVVPNE